MSMIAVEAPARGPDCMAYYLAVDTYITDILIDGQQVSHGNRTGTVVQFHDVTGPRHPALSIVRFEPVVPQYSQTADPVTPEQWSQDFYVREGYYTKWFWTKIGDKPVQRITEDRPDSLSSIAPAGNLLRALERHVREDRLVTALKRSQVKKLLDRD